jgi:hypothetical protein
MVSFFGTRSKRLVALAGTASILYANVALAALPPDVVSTTDKLLTDTITQVQGVMQSMSLGCSGGPGGQPLVNSGALQTQGNMGLNALQNARVALANGDIATVVQQIGAGEAGVDNMINGAHNNCSGGCCGVDPAGFGGWQSTWGNLRGPLEGARRFLPLFPH